MSPHLCSRKGTICFTWLDRCECYCKSKASFSLPINPRLLAATRLKCKLKIQKAGDFSSAQKNQHRSTLSMRTQCFFHTYICAYASCTHIYTADIHVLYAQLHIFGSKLSRGYKKKKHIRAAGLRRSNSNWEPTASDHPEQSSDTTQIRRTQKEETQIKTTTHRN